MKRRRVESQTAGAICSVANLRNSAVCRSEIPSLLEAAWIAVHHSDTDDLFVQRSVGNRQSRETAIVFDAIDLNKKLSSDFPSLRAVYRGSKAAVCDPRGCLRARRRIRDASCWWSCHGRRPCAATVKRYSKCTLDCKAVLVDLNQPLVLQNFHGRCW